MNTPVRDVPKRFKSDEELWNDFCDFFNECAYWLVESRVPAEWTYSYYCRTSREDRQRLQNLIYQRCNCNDQEIPSRIKLEKVEVPTR
jgi:hypothetical protein